MPLLAVLVWSGAAQTDEKASLSSVRTVYLLPMASGMDQYLASQLTREHVLHVVTDPTKADAVLTDHLGAAFEASLKEAYPEFRPSAHTSDSKSDRATVKVAESDKASAPEKAGGKASDQPPSQQTGKAPTADSVDEAKSTPSMDLKSVGAERARTTMRAHGTLFMVRRGTWDVIWSAYAEPARGQSKQMDKTAAKLVSQLKASMKSSSAISPDGK